MKDYMMEWRVHSKTSTFLRQLTRSRAVIEDALGRGIRFCVMWSGGKDSTAMAHLVNSIDPSIPMVSQFDDCDWPEKRPYMERIVDMFGWMHYTVEPGFSVWEAAKGYGIGKENLCSTDHALTREGFLKPLWAVQEALGCNGTFLGFRVQENPKTRKKNFEKRGHLYQLANGTWRCCPLSMWSTRDVFAYHVANDIEINPCYLQNAICQPEEIRLSWALPTVGWKGRDLEHIRRYYPAQFRRLREEGVQ